MVEEPDLRRDVAYAAAGRRQQGLRGVYADVRDVVRWRHLHDFLEEPPELRRRVVRDFREVLRLNVLRVVLVQVGDGPADRLVPARGSHLLLRAPVYGRGADARLAVCGENGPYRDAVKVVRPVCDEAVEPLHDRLARFHDFAVAVRVDGGLVRRVQLLRRVAQHVVRRAPSRHVRVESVGEHDAPLGVLDAERHVRSVFHQVDEEFHRWAGRLEELALHFGDARRRNCLLCVSGAMVHERIIHFSAREVQASKRKI